MPRGDRFTYTTLTLYSFILSLSWSQALFFGNGKGFDLRRKLGVIKMEAAEEALCGMEDEIETLHDPSHDHNLSKDDFAGLFKDLTIQARITQLRKQLKFV